MYAFIMTTNNKRETNAEMKEVSLYPTAVEEERWICFIELALMRC